MESNPHEKYPTKDKCPLKKGNHLLKIGKRILKTHITRSEINKLVKSNKERTPNAYLLFKNANKFNPTNGKDKYYNLPNNVRYNYKRCAEVIRFVKKVKKNNDPEKIYRMITSPLCILNYDKTFFELSAKNTTKVKVNKPKKKLTHHPSHDEKMHHVELARLARGTMESSSGHVINNMLPVDPNTSISSLYGDNTKEPQSPVEQTTCAESTQIKIPDNFTNDASPVALNMNVLSLYDKHQPSTELTTHNFHNFTNDSSLMASNSDMHSPYNVQITKDQMFQLFLEQTTREGLTQDIIRDNFADNMPHVVPISLNGDNIDEELWSFLQSPHQSSDDIMGQNSNIQPFDYDYIANGPTLTNNMFIADNTNVLVLPGKQQLQTPTSEIYS
ncbi:18127_t:CDS:1 [Racocetra fulgida]|uniref:18127_t:CDS:1 n=1 Tax=Racocetra fulgida TaxID=60492 RepID=A0A9N9E8U1_9GLOM|nr:18127_t:CDS:1 [Racocetra fulgida]